MTTLTLPYYAGLLTAAEYHGAAHQRPQEFQVLVEKARRRIECGNVRVGFFVRKNLRRVPTQTLNTRRGFIVVSTPGRLVTAAPAAPVPWAQRLGYLLELAGAGGKTEPLQQYVRAHVHESVLLRPGAPRGTSSRQDAWKLFVNAEVETDL